MTWTMMGGVMVTVTFSRKSLRYTTLGLGIVLLGALAWGIFFFLDGWISVVPSGMGFIVSGILNPVIIEALNQRKKRA